MTSVSVVSCFRFVIFLAESVSDCQLFHLWVIQMQGNLYVSRRNNGTAEVVLLGNPLFSIG